MRKQDKQGTVFSKFLLVMIILAILSGGLMMIKFDAIYSMVAMAYTVFDISIVVIILLAIYNLVKNQFSSQKILSKP